MSRRNGKSRRTVARLPPQPLYAYWMRDVCRPMAPSRWPWLLRAGDNKRKLAERRRRELADGYAVTGIGEFYAHAWGVPWITMPERPR
jgi:hypothetical protein